MLPVKQFGKRRITEGVLAGQPTYIRYPSFSRDYIENEQNNFRHANPVLPTILRISIYR